MTRFDKGVLGRGSPVARAVLARWGRPAAVTAGEVGEARAALAADGPAVPEGREPASVTGEPSDEDLNAFWNGCGIADEHGHHETNELAVS